MEWIDGDDLLEKTSNNNACSLFILWTSDKVLCLLIIIIMFECNILCSNILFSLIIIFQLPFWLVLKHRENFAILRNIYQIIYWPFWRLHIRSWIWSVFFTCSEKDPFELNKSGFFNFRWMKLFHALVDLIFLRQCST